MVYSRLDTLLENPVEIWNKKRTIKINPELQFFFSKEGNESKLERLSRQQKIQDTGNLLLNLFLI